MSKANALSSEETLVVNAAASESTPHHHNHSRAYASQKPGTLERHRVSTQTQREHSLRDVCADIHGRVTRFLSAQAPDEVTQRTQAQTRVATSVIEQALRDYDFDSLSISYNGGKDCLVLLLLYLSVLHTHFTQPSGRRRRPDETTTTTTTNNTTSSTAPDRDEDFPTSIPSIYAKPPDPFDAVTTFVESSTQDYHLDLTHISTNPGSKAKSKSHASPPPTTPSKLPASLATTNGEIPSPLPLTTSSNSTADNKDTTPTVSFRDAFALYLQANPNVRAIFVGTRRTDPHGTTLTHFQTTDGNWPRFMRIHPVIDWRLSEIWCFLRSDHLADPRSGSPLEYCGMYDMGYTSLGGVGDTLRNPRLRYKDDDGRERYLPAYTMTEDVDERAGRE